MNEDINFYDEELSALQDEIRRGIDSLPRLRGSDRAEVLLAGGIGGWVLWCLMVHPLPTLAEAQPAQRPHAAGKARAAQLSGRDEGALQG